MHADELYTAARLYYVEERGQAEIAERLGVSRSTVSRLLADARREGIVRIEVVPPPVPDALATELAGVLGFRDVHVTRSGRGRPLWGELTAALGRALTATGVGAGDAVLVSWGRTMWEIVQHPLPILPGITVAPAMAAATEPEEWFETNTIVRRVAAAMRGVPYLLQAPPHPSPTLRRALYRDIPTRQTLELWDSAQVLLTSVGAPPGLMGDYGPKGHARDKRHWALAAGDVASRYFDVHGNPLVNQDDALLLGVSWEQLHHIPHKLAVCVGEQRTRSIIGASRARLVDVLVTDQRTAEATLAEVGRQTAA